MGRSGADFVDPSGALGGLGSDFGIRFGNRSIKLSLNVGLCFCSDPLSLGAGVFERLLVSRLSVFRLGFQLRRGIQVIRNRRPTIIDDPARFAASAMRLRIQ